MEHLTNCHGEWLYFIQMLGLVPFVGAWMRLTFKHHQHKDH